MRRGGIAAAAIALAALASAAPASAANVVVNDDPAGNPADVGPPGANCAVPPNATTINAANALAVAGDTLLVCSGTYATGTLTKQLTLLGAQAGVDARTRFVPVAQESVITPTLSPANVAGTVIDGFTFTGNTANVGINFGNGAGASTIVNNILNNHRRAIQLSSASATTRIATNRFTDNGKTGTPTGAIYTGGPLTGVTIEQNLFDDTAGPSGVIQINPNAPSRATTLRIVNNEFTNIATNGLVIFESDNAEISGNTFAGGNSAMIFLGGDNTGTQVTGNTIGAGTASGVALSNVGFPNTNSGVTVSGNTITGRSASVALSNGGHTGGGLVVTENRFLNNTGGVLDNHPTEPISAINNWWGCAAGPGSAGCDPVTGVGAANVDFDPWLTITVTASPTSVEIGGNASTITADLNFNSDGQNVGTVHPDGYPVTWATDLGTIAPASPLTAGVATATLTSGPAPGTANPAATVDNGTVSTPVAFVDTSPPDTQITSGPTGGVTIASSTATFEFDSPDDPAATFECRLDSGDPGAFAPCTSPYTTPALADGPHVFEVRAVDASNNPDPTPARGLFNVDTTPPPVTPTTPSGGGTAGTGAGQQAGTGACGNRIPGDAKPNDLRGTGGGDRILGFGADDRLRGRAGFDCLKGGRANDSISGGIAGDILQGGPGDDSLNSRDGNRDKVNCGPGVDVGLVDQRDVVRGCETLRVRRLDSVV